jgi:serine/threonine-protein kinase
MAEEILDGYRLLRHLQTGQSSQVWEVVHVSSARHFALKILLPEKGRDRDSRRLFIHEAEVGKQLAHENIIKIQSIKREGEQPYFIMEFFPSGSLRLRLVPKHKAFLYEKAHEILKQSATAFAFMNAKGWVHRDIKPDNILVNSAGEVRIIDFALAQRIPKGFFARLFRRKRKAQGTRSYMSPEQIRGLALDTRADIYSFGITCYELVAGRTPFRGNSSQELLTKHIIEKPITPKHYNPDVTDEFATLILRMLGKKKEDRPRDFHEVLMQMRGIRVFAADALVTEGQEE